MPRTLRPLWTCPRCAAKFVVANSWHSCGRYRLEDLFARSEPHVLELFRKLQRMVHAAGPVTTVPQKTRLVFMVRVRFISVQVRKSYLLVGFLLARRVDDPRFAEITTYSPRNHVHVLRVSAPADLDAQVARWIREARKVGLQRHLTGA